VRVCTGTESLSVTGGDHGGGGVHVFSGGSQTTLGGVQSDWTGVQLDVGGVQPEDGGVFYNKKHISH